MSALTSLLVRDGVVPVRKIEEALQRQVIAGGDVETVLLEMDAVAENVLAAYRAALYGLAPATRAEVMAVPPEVIGLVPAEVANDHALIPLALRGQTLEVASRAPLRPEQEEALGFLLGYEVQARIACDVRIAAGLAHHFGASLSPRFTRLVERLRTRDAGPSPAIRVRPEASMVDVPYARAVPDAFDGDTRPLTAPRVSRPRRTTSRGLGAVTDEAIAARRRTPVAGIPDDDEEMDAGPVVWPSTEAPRDPGEAPVQTPQSEAGPAFTLAEGEERLKGASSRDEILEVFFAFARQSFEYAALFVVHDQVADGREAAGEGAQQGEVRAISIPLEPPSVFAEVRRLRAPLVRRLGATDVEREVLAGLRRPPRSTAMVLPVPIRQRVVLLVYGDRGGEPFDLGDVMELVRFTSRVVESLEQLILRKKRGLPRQATPAPERPAPAPPAADSWSSVPPGPPKARPPHSPAPSEPSASILPPDAPPQLVLGIPRSAPPPPPSAEIDLGAPEISAALSELVAKGKAEDASTELVVDEAEDHEADAEEDEDRREEDDDDDIEIEVSEGDGDDDFDDDFDDLEDVEEPRYALPERKPGTYKLRGGPIDVVHPAPSRRRSSLAPSERDGDTRSVIVDMGDQVHEQVEDLLVAPPGERDQLIRGLLYMGEAALPALVQAFPGPVQVERSESPVPAGRDVSVIARALVAFGERAVPYVAGLLSDGDADVRYYASLVASELVHPGLMDPVRERVHDPDPDVRRLACALLPRFAGFRGFDEVRILIRRAARLRGKDPSRRWQALDALVALRDVESLEKIIELLQEDDAELIDHAHRALVILTCTDCGRSYRRWRSWFEKHGVKHRIEWLIEGLVHGEESVRALAGMELERLTQERYGFHAGAPKKDRERAHRQYRRWWERDGARRFA